MAKEALEIPCHEELLHLLRGSQASCLPRSEAEARARSGKFANEWAPSSSLQVHPLTWDSTMASTLALRQRKHRRWLLAPWQMILSKQRLLSAEETRWCKKRRRPEATDRWSQRTCLQGSL